MMQKQLLGTVLLFLSSRGLFAQAPVVKQLYFEVATIKPWDPDRHPMPSGTSGGPGPPLRGELPTA